MQIQQSQGPFEIGIFGIIGWDPAGVITIASFIVLVLMYLLWHQLKRYNEFK